MRGREQPRRLQSQRAGTGFPDAGRRPRYDAAMRRTLMRLAPILHLTRVTTAFAAVANVWFVILWSSRCPDEPATRAIQEMPLWALLLGGAMNALGLFAYAASLNDILDFR